MSMVDEAEHAKSDNTLQSSDLAGRDIRHARKIASTHYRSVPCRLAKESPQWS